MTHSFNRSTLETSTTEFKQHFRQYLKTLATDDNEDRVQLIERLEWCFDIWEHWRQKFYPDADLMFPFFQSGKRGSEFGHYSRIGSSGQPSVIHIKRSLLMGGKDLIVHHVSSTKKLVLKGDSPGRNLFVARVILHELVHQYLHEAAPEADRSRAGDYKGHGPLFAAECNRINKVLHEEDGLEFVPVRHTKRSHAKLADKQRPSCAQFTHGEIFCKWDDTNPDLTKEQHQENRERLEQALEFYGGAVVVVEEAQEVETDFPAPFDSSCADVCIQQLKDYDEANDSNLLEHFLKAVLEHNGAAPAAPVNIPAAEAENGIVPTVPSTEDTQDDEALDLTTDYPLTSPAAALQDLLGDIEASGLTRADFARLCFGHKNGQQLSRHLKRLREGVAQLVAA